MVSKTSCIFVCFILYFNQGCILNLELRVCAAVSVGGGDPDNPQIQHSGVGVIHESPANKF